MSGSPPVLRKWLRTSDDDRVVELLRDRDEVGDEVKGHREATDQH
jgi:hypothetical protein